MYIHYTLYDNQKKSKNTFGNITEKLKHTWCPFKNGQNYILAYSGSQGRNWVILRGGRRYNIVVIVMSPSMFSSSNGVYYVLIYLSMCLNLCTLLSNEL